MPPFKRPPSRPQPPGLALALSRPPAWPTPALPCQAVRRAPGRPPEQPKPMRAPRPAAGADEKELPAREEELRINAVQESIPAVRGMEPPSHRLYWERVPDSTSSRVCGSQLLTWIHPPVDPAPWRETSSPGIPCPCSPWATPAFGGPRSGARPCPSPLDLQSSASQIRDPEPALLPGDASAHPI